MNISQTMTNKTKMGLGRSVAAALALGSVASVCQAGTVPSNVSAPVGAGLQSVGGVVYAAGMGHAGIAPIVNSTAPNLEPVTDGVTNGLLSVGGGIRSSGLLVQYGGLAVHPVGGVRSGLQTLRNGTLVKAQVGSVAIGKASPTTVVGVGALTTTPPQGTLATAGVADANALLNTNVAPQ